MSVSLIDLSRCGDLGQLAEVVAALWRCAPTCVPLLTGATARDVLLSHAHGIAIARATMDIDFAFAVDDWKTYERLQEALLAGGNFTRDSRIQHRLHFNEALKVDLLPFGGVERADRTIAWPPQGAIVFQVLGYREAMANAVTVRLPSNQQIAVVSLPALAVLKLMAWHDRHYDQPRKDASDLWLVMRYYLEAGNYDRLYEEAAHLLNDPGFDLDRAGAWLLGYDARRVLLSSEDSETALASVERVLQPEILSDGPLQLAGEMRNTDPETSLSLLSAFHAGLTGKDTP
jgi:predicted nucleotidyltransferase